MHIKIWDGSKDKWNKSKSTNHREFFYFPSKEFRVDFLQDELAVDLGILLKRNWDAKVISLLVTHILANIVMGILVNILKEENSRFGSVNLLTISRTKEIKSLFKIMVVRFRCLNYKDQIISKKKDKIE